MITVIMKFTFPTWPPQFWDVPEEFITVRQEYFSDGRIIDNKKDDIPETKTVVFTTIFENNEVFEQWKEEPAVKSFFEYRNQFCETNGITKVVEIL